jgi:NAD(P)-dependent dehydrogenase (short-subunit alcohol dehydrogenase family)
MKLIAMAPTAIRFDDAELQEFAAISHDRNPLHLSAAYARRTSFGQPVVYGMLGVLRALTAAGQTGGRNVERISVTFRNPLFTGVEYRVRSTETKSGTIKLTIEETGTIATTILMTLGSDAPPPWQLEDAAAYAPTTTPVARSAESLHEGLTVTGRYAPDRAAFGSWAASLHLDGTGLTAIQVTCLLWASYVVGMELPGERALFSKFEMSFQPAAFRPADELEYKAAITSFDDRFDLAEISATLTTRGKPVAEAAISSFVRRDTPELDLVALHAALAPSEALRGKLAVVVGGSRGLGAAIVAALTSQGCEVVLVHRSGASEVSSLQERVRGHSGSIVSFAADAGDENDCRRLRDMLASRGNALDLLICNAAPPLRPIPISENSITRLRQFVDASLALTAAPLGACLDLLARRNGTAVLISSAVASPAAEKYPPNWMHYVAAKSAAEGLCRALAAQTPAVRFLIARPPRLLTDQTNTPQGRHAAQPVEAVAARIVGKLCESNLPHISILEEFAAQEQ